MRRAITLGAKIGYCLFGLGIAAALILMDWRWAVAGFVAMWISAALGLPTKESARSEMVRLEAKIQRAHYLADQWERESGTQNLPNRPHPWDQLRHALDGTGK